MKFDYEKNNKATEVKERTDKLLKKYPNKVPIIVQFDKAFIFKERINTKFITPGDLSVAEFMIIIRKRCKLNDDEAIFIFFDGDSLEPSHKLLKEVYKEKKREDTGVLFCMVMKESVFG